MTSLPNLDHLTPEQLRALAAQLMQRVETLDQQVETMGKTVETMGKKINRDQTVIEKLTHEIAQLKRLKFAKRSEQLNPQQASLLDDLIDTDIAAIEDELQAFANSPYADREKAKAQAHRVAGRISTHVDPSRTGQRRIVYAAVHSSASVRTSPRSGTPRPAYLPSSAMFVENGYAMTARR